MAGSRPSDLLPLRPNVGAVLFNRVGFVLVARRAGLADAGRASAGSQPTLGWQLPQGGIDRGETPQSALLRELAEEIGTDRFRIIGEHPDWLSYELPPELVGVALGGHFRGQRQRWFALRFEGEERDIRLDRDPHPEFDAWRWVTLAELPRLAIGFKRAIYETLAASFVRFTVSEPEA